MAHHDEDGPNSLDITAPRRRPMHTLGHVQLQHKTTGATILVPQPSSDPNDPLNW